MITAALVFSVAMLLMAALIRAAGASLVRTPRADALQDAANGDLRAARSADLLEDRAGLQPSINVVHSALLLAATVPAVWVASERSMSAGARFGLFVSLGLVVLFLGDVVPRSVGRGASSSFSYRWSRLLSIVVRVGSAANDLVEDDEPDEDQTAEDDLADAQEMELITSVIDFSDTLVREVMVPRTDMQTIQGALTSDEALDAVIEHGYSRIPVIGSDVDDVLGLLFAKDLLKIMDEEAGPQPIQSIMRQMYFVPETKKVPDLLRSMQASGSHMAVVVDEFGGTSGIVTIEDLLEELVGEIVDEFDTEEPLVVPETDGTLMVDARLAVEELSELVGEDLPDEEWDTVGGLMLGLAGRVPEEGESFYVGDVMLTCTQVQGRRVSKVRVSRIGQPLTADSV